MPRAVASCSSSSTSPVSTASLPLQPPAYPTPDLYPPLQVDTLLVDVPAKSLAGLLRVWHWCTVPAKPPPPCDTFVAIDEATDTGCAMVVGELPPLLNIK